MRTFVLVGHCGPDMHLLKGAVRRAVPGAQVEVADDAAALQSHLHGGAVLLINRVLEDGFNTESGISLIADLSQRHDPPVMLLISNFAEAHEQATAAGARPGFGKREVHSERAARLLRDAAAAPAINE